MEGIQQYHEIGLLDYPSSPSLLLESRMKPFCQVAGTLLMEIVYFSIEVSLWYLKFWYQPYHKTLVSTVNI